MKKSLIGFVNKLPKGMFTFITLFLIIYISLDSNPFDVNKIHLFPGADKIIHALMYGFLVMVSVFDISKIKSYSKPCFGLYMCSVLFSIIVGVLMEFLQESMNLGRGFDLYDIYADAVGAIIGFLVMRFFILDFIIKFMSIEED